MSTTSLHPSSGPHQSVISPLQAMWSKISVKRLKVAGVRSVARLLPTARSRCGIYVLAFADGEYYVGRTVNFASRFPDHCKKWDDITEVLFYRMARRDLIQAEDDAIRDLEARKVPLRNKAKVTEVHCRTAFDAIVEPSEQKRWLVSSPSDDLAGGYERHDRPEQRRRNRTNLDRLVADPRFATLVPALRRYIAWTVPVPRRTELSHWAISAVPSTSTNTWPRLTTLTIHSLETLYVYAPVNQQTRTMITINVDLPTILAQWATLHQLMKHFGGVHAEEVEYGVRRDVLALQVEGVRDLLRLLEVPGVVAAARRLNLQLMRKGICFQQRAHSFGFADRLLEPRDDGWIPADLTSTARHRSSGPVTA